MGSEPNPSTSDPGSRRRPLELIETLAVLAAAIVVTGVAVDSEMARRTTPTHRQLPLPAEPLSMAGVELKGNSAARVVMLEFSDFECPFCGRFARETLPSIEARYVDSGEILLGFRNMPGPAHRYGCRRGSGRRVRRRAREILGDALDPV